MLNERMNETRPVQQCIYCHLWFRYLEAHDCPERSEVMAQIEESDGPIAALLIGGSFLALSVALGIGMFLARWLWWVTTGN